MIVTPRLLLVPATLEALRAELETPSRLADVIRMDVPGSWPPELFDRDPIEFTIRQLELHPDHAEWWMYYFAKKATPGNSERIIGAGGFKGPPGDDGTVEIGYSIVPEERRKGYASEAASGLVAHAFRYRSVRRVIAETLPELVASIGVLEKCGFRFIGDGSGPGIIRFEIEKPSSL